MQKSVVVLKYLSLELENKAVPNNNKNNTAYIIIILYLDFKNHVSQALCEAGRSGIMLMLKMRKVTVSDIFVISEGMRVWVRACTCVCMYVYEKNKSHING